MEWIKAIERVPENRALVFCKWIAYDRTEITRDVAFFDGEEFLSIIEESAGARIIIPKDKCLWLDEDAEDESGGYIIGGQNQIS